MVQAPGVTFLIRSYLLGPRSVTIYRLTSGFASATPVSTLREPTSGDNGVDDAFAFDSSHLWLGFVDIDRGGAPAWLYRTNDGGAHWISSPYPGHDFHGGSGDYPLFDSPDDGWLLNDSEVAQYTTVFHTSDGGAHWQVLARNGAEIRHRQPIGYAPLLRTPEGHLWQEVYLQGPRPYLTHSLDGGHHWTRVPLPVWAPHKEQACIGNLTSITDAILLPYATPSRHHRSRLIVLRYDDGHWTSSNPVLIHGQLQGLADSQIAISNDQTWTIRPGIGYHPPLVTTTDAGRTWTVHPLPRKLNRTCNFCQLSADPDSPALLLGDWHAPTPAGPWHQLTLRKENS